MNSSIFKSILSLTLAFMLSFSLTACSNNVNEIEQKISEIDNVSVDSRESLEAIDAEYQKLSDEDKGRVGNYDALQAALDECNFLNAVEQSISNRMENKDSDDRLTLVNTELAFLDEFREMTFADETLQALKDEYFEGLDIQKNSLSAEFSYSQQVEWQRGYVYRNEALVGLYNDYGIMASNNDFVGTYVSGYDKQKALLDAFDAIEADIAAQSESFDFQYNDRDNSMSFVVANNTSYKFSTVWEFSFKDESGTVTETANAYSENVQPNSSYIVKVYLTDQDSGMGGFEWSNYYTDVVV